MAITKPSGPPTLNPTAAQDLAEPFPDPVVIPITGVLDLHTFSPREVAPLLEDYLEACQAQGILTARIIHGKGTGQLKARVRSLLAENPLVLAYEDAAQAEGGWGATVVRLRPPAEGGE